MQLRLLSSIALAITALAAGAQQSGYDDPPTRIPFVSGESLTYTLKVGFLNAGAATMHVVGMEATRGIPTMHTVFDIKGKVLFKKVENHYESWFDTATMTSLRHIQIVNDGEDQNKDYQFFPERKVYIKNGETKPSVAKPLDEGSFIYYLRALPLAVGKTYTIARYYNADHNPVIVRVVGREHIKVAAGEFDAFVIEPVIKSRGLFGEEAHAQVWLADNPQRLLLRLKSKLPVGTLTMELKKVENDSSR